jgi:hypothetical protein
VLVAVPCAPATDYIPECACGEPLPSSTHTGNQLVHHVQHATIRLHDKAVSHEVDVQLAGSDLVDSLQLGCAAELILRCSPELAGGQALMLKVAHTLQVMHAMRLPIAALRASELKCSLQMTNAQCEEREHPLQHLMHLLAASAGVPVPGQGPVTWYMLLAVLLSAVAVGEELRESKLPGHKDHRCQVCDYHRLGRTGSIMTAMQGKSWLGQ